MVNHGGNWNSSAPSLPACDSGVERGEEPFPDLLVRVGRQVVGVDVLLVGLRPQVLVDRGELGRVPGQQAERLDVEDEAVRSALRPQGRGRLRRRRVVGGVDLDHRESRGVVRQPLLRGVHVGRVPARREQRLVGPGRGSDPDPVLRARGHDASLPVSARRHSPLGRRDLGPLTLRALQLDGPTALRCCGFALLLVAQHALTCVFVIGRPAVWAASITESYVLREEEQSKANMRTVPSSLLGHRACAAMRRRLAATPTAGRRCAERVRPLWREAQGARISRTIISLGSDTIYSIVDKFRSHPAMRRSPSIVCGTYGGSPRVTVSEIRAVA